MTFDPGTPPEAAATDDHVLAAWLADAAGDRLLEVREEGLEGRALKDAGDQAAHELLMSLLAEHRPDDAVLSEEGADDKAPPRRRRGSGSSTRSTAPVSSPSRRATTGPCTWRCGPTGSSSPAPSPSRRWARRSTPGSRRRCRRRSSDGPAHRGLAQPPAGVRRGAGQGDRRRAGADGLGRREGDVRGPRRRRRLRARGWAVRVGQRRPGRGGPRRRSVLLAHRRLRAASTTRTTCRCPT